METGSNELITQRSLTTGNLALQQSMRTLWDDFVDSVSGELRLVHPTREGRPQG
ncbi:MAG: hypothetical protein IPK79_08410 [Vampirovibrionales bacterium]|nr:hypothetical protein [Vampirovibrionales bacterium]